MKSDFWNIGELLLLGMLKIGKEEGHRLQPPTLQSFPKTAGMLHLTERSDEMRGIHRHRIDGNQALQILLNRRDQLFLDPRIRVNNNLGRTKLKDKFLHFPQFIKAFCRVFSERKISPSDMIV